MPPVEYNKRYLFGRIVDKPLMGATDICLEQVRAANAWHYRKEQNEHTGINRQLYAKMEAESGFC